MKDDKPISRGELFRQSAVFQLKLLVDGFRDLVLVPVSLVATMAGLLRGGAEPDREFRQVLEFGRKTDRWINLFGNHPRTPGEQATSLDALLERAETVVREQAREGGISEGAANAVQRALNAAQRSAGAVRPALDTDVKRAPETPDKNGQ